MNFFQRIGKWLKGAVKIRPAQVKVNHKDVPALDTLAAGANALTGAAIDKGEAQAESATAAMAESAASRFAAGK